jgi:hypothetical protein
LEKYDAIGAHREKMRVTVPSFNRRQESQRVELPIDSSGWVTGIRDSNFSSPRELGRVLASSPTCQECVVKQYFRYAMGRHERPMDRPVLEATANTFRTSQFKFKELIIALVKGTEFPPSGDAKDDRTVVTQNVP